MQKYNKYFDFPLFSCNFVLMKLSIVIPIYNVEDTIDRCVESVLHQGIDDFEVILVDDGSPDRSGEICDEWTRKDTHITVIHRTNGGLSAARNSGIEKATGELITFVDSDDYLKEGTYCAIMPIAEKHDIVEFPVCRLFKSSQQQTLSFSYQIFTDKKAYWLEAKGYTHTYAWNKIYKRSLFDHIRYPAGRVFEDAATFPKLLLAAKDICTTHQGLYYYCWNDEGITAKAKGPELESLLHGHLESLKLWHDAAYYLHVLNIQMDVYEMTGKPPFLPFKRINPFGTGLDSKQRMKAIMLNLFGLKGICKINKMIHRWKRNRS